MSATSRTAGSDIEPSLLAIVVGMLIVGTLYAAGVVSAVLSGHPVPHPAIGLLAPVEAFAHLHDPSAAWHASVGGPVLYWSLQLVFFAVLVALLYLEWRVFRPTKSRSQLAGGDPTQIKGVADRKHVEAIAGPKALMAQAKVLRPSLDKPKPRDVGFCLGTSRGVECWMGVRDSLVILGPPGSGKGLNLVIPSIIDAPGAVITTSTRPDNLAVTLKARSTEGRPVAVFDPQGLAPGAPSSVRWSPIRGCENPQTAMIRAAALCADAGRGVTEANFWQQQTQTAMRCLLHAAAVAGLGASALYEWSLSPTAAAEAVAILSKNPNATPTWNRALGAIVSADPRLRDSVWAMVGTSLAALGDPQVLEAVSPSHGEEFDPVDFIRRRGTLYLLGTSTGAAATAGLVSAFIEDVVEVARRMAAASPGARLDPPLALILDEAANYPLPSLGSLMSEGGGSGIPTMVVLQSLAQARDRWGSETAHAIWDSATAKIVLGGVANADDLADISRLVGEREVQEVTESYHSGSKSYSTSTRRVNVLDPAMIRTLKFGHGLLLFRSSQPIILTLRPWISRDDADRLRSDQASIEALLQQGAKARWHRA